MSKYRVTVNGNQYEVEIENLDGSQAASSVVSQPRLAPQAAPQVAAPQVTAPAPAAAPAPSAAGKSVQAPMQGKITMVNVSAGQVVKKGDVIAVLEAMKMENEIMAAEDATIASVNVSAGQTVEAGDSIVSLG